MPPPAKHRQSIVDAAVTLFRQRGYAATGTADIVALSGAPKGSLYHYFPGGKAAIGQAAVEEAGRRILETLEDLSRQSNTCGDLVKAHARLLAGWMAKSGYRDGAPMTTVLLENAPHDPAITASGRDALRAWRGLLSTRLVAEGVATERAERLASLTVAALDGALVQARVEQSEQPLHWAAEELAALYEAANLP
ncbi:TetR/AcrR family transcriptional regulator [Phenylobacterium sp.]|uniref:TetR/AcrR family transcriptional regulator n=1 Tax=Phenylobacterium sp. TaxID=1871053 RepID=UPI002E2FBEF1|nr:TetR/AcrR family transcriptional regulator [Phenylobacterium sp.]HEX2561419.1 TetR/AcrR family transcriptional regulator [Phenylobacterium sp.]